MKFSSHILKPESADKTIFNLDDYECEWTKSIPSIPEFYGGQEIFVTGASGFMGKVLIEKLLRSCPDIKQIYVLLRTKKGNSIETRLKSILDLPLFTPLRKMFPTIVEKLIPVEGDVSELQLGLSQDNMKRMKNVSIIFHSAASVRFDDNLKYAVHMNTRGTREIMEFAKTLDNLKVVMHVSTTYSHPELKVVGEVIHKPYVDWRKTIKISEEIDGETLDMLTPKYMKFMPNTYTFTKALAEQVVDDYKHELPLVLLRPSIVISSMKEPIPGWIDNFNGPVGLLVGSGLGVTRTMYCNPDNIADFTPVDVCIKAMIVGAWKRAFEPSGSLPVYNCSTSNQRFATMEQIIEMGKGMQDEFPLDKMLWAPGGGLTRCRYLNYLKVIFLHLLPAILVDFALGLKGHKPFLVRLQRKIYQANLALEHFILNNWHFRNENFINLCSHLKLADMKSFNYNNFLEYDIILYFRYACLGARRYLLREKDKNLPKALKNFYRMKYLNYFVQTSIYGSIIFFLLKNDFLKLTSIFCTMFQYEKC